MNILTTKCIGQSEPGPSFKLKDLNTCNANHAGRLRCSILINFQPFFAAHTADRSSKTICEVVINDMSDHTDLFKSLGGPNRAGSLRKCTAHRTSDDPQRSLGAEHWAWSCRTRSLAIVSGDQGILCRRAGRQRLLETTIATRRARTSSRRPCAFITIREAQPLGDDIIHSVANRNKSRPRSACTSRAAFLGRHGSKWEKIRTHSASILSDSKIQRERIFRGSQIGTTRRVLVVGTKSVLAADVWYNPMLAVVAHHVVAVAPIPHSDMEPRRAPMKR